MATSSFQGLLVIRPVAANHVTCGIANIFVNSCNLRLKRLRSNQQSTTAHINAAFPLFTFNSVLIAMSEIQASSYQLLCLIEGESVVFPVEVACSAIVGQLKKVIQAERALGSLKNVDPHALELWKVSAIHQSR
jgi:hypothetical protein